MSAELRPPAPTAAAQTPGDQVSDRALLERVRADQVQFINLQFTDILGGLKSVTVPAATLGNALEKGVWFDGSSIEGFARIHESDMVLRPDTSTYGILPWELPERRQARLICDVQMPDGRPFDGDPRRVLKRQLERAAALGYTFNAGPELEFFLFRKSSQDEAPRFRPVPHDVGAYFDFSPQDLALVVRNEIMRTAEQLGMQAESAHHEVGAGQHEIDIRYADALTAADNVITLRHAIKAVAAEHGLYATFMPKPIYGANGSGMHVHQSLFDRQGRNLFFDSNGSRGLSALAQHFVAGQLAHAKAITAVTAPTVNSYKRLTPGYEAPVYICWAHVNRSALIRVPKYSPGSEQSARVELRSPDPSANPYLAFAVMLAAGLDGIERRLPPAEPVEGDVYHFDSDRLAELKIECLPHTLAEALGELERNAVIREALGDHVFGAFSRAKRAEWDEYRVQVTDWEISRYLEAL
ncbi:MAG: type I glutamate--ammonia ligase [Candidatus Eisenbacteria bacterium]